MEWKMTKSNIIKNFYLYGMYFAGVTIVLTVFVAFSLFISDHVILEKISEDGRVETMAQAIFLVLIIFSVFFCLYFNNFFIKKRSKEMGILALLGFSKAQIIKMTCYESAIILSMSYIFSLLLGFLLYLGIVQCVIQLLSLGISIQFAMQGSVVMKTLLVVMLLLLLNGFINIILISRYSLIEFVHYAKKEEKVVALKKYKGFIAIVCLILAYMLCVLSIFKENSIWIKIGVSPMFVVVFLLIGVGSYFIIKYGVILFLARRKKDENKLYTPLGNILYPKLVARIGTKSKLLIVLSALLTLTVTVAGIMVITLVYPLKAVDRITPSAIEYKKDSNQTFYQTKKEYIAKKYNVIEMEVPLIRLNTTPDVPITETGKTLNFFDVMKYDDYKKIMKSQNKEASIEKIDGLNNALLINYYPTQKPLNQKFMLESRYEITVQKLTTNNILSFASSVTTLVVADELFEKIEQDFKQKRIIVATYNNKELRNNKEFYQDFLDIGEFQSSYLKKYNIVRDNASTFIFISFIAVLLMICTASILYFTNLIEILENSEEYSYMKKIGYTTKQVFKIIDKEIGILFQLPIIVGILNGFFIVFAFRFIFIDNLIETRDLFSVIGITMFVFILCYAIFYVITKSVVRKLITL